MSIANALKYISCCISFTNRIFEGNPRQETGRNWIPRWSLDEALFHPNSRCHSSSLNVYPTQSSSADINRCLRLVPWNQQLQRIHWNPHFPRCYIKIALLYSILLRIYDDENSRTTSLLYLALCCRCTLKKASGFISSEISKTADNSWFFCTAGSHISANARALLTKERRYCSTCNGPSHKVYHDFGVCKMIENT